MEKLLEQALLEGLKLLAEEQLRLRVTFSRKECASRLSKFIVCYIRETTREVA